MKRVALSLMAPLLAVACGSSPTSPSTPPASIVPGLTLIVVTTPDRLVPPTTLSVAVGESSGLGGTIEAATLKVTDAVGVTLADETLALGTPIPANGGLGRFQIKLSWPLERGSGKRLDLGVTVRDAFGQLRTISSVFTVK